VTAALKYDATAPSATGTLARAPDGNGWYNRPVALRCRAPISPPQSRRARARATGPDSASRDLVGNVWRPGREHERSGDGDDDRMTRRRRPALAGRAGRRTRTAWPNRPLTIVFAQVAGDVSESDTCSPSVSYGA
jgi:hypothetical protein